MSKRNRQSLSKNLMQMKFMQKTKQKNDKEIEDKSNKRLIDEELSESMRKEGEKYLISSSNLYCEQLKFSRMSFNGMNHEIEKLMQENNDLNETEVKTDNNLEVSDEEMTNRYSYLIDSNGSRRKRAKYSHRNSTPYKKFK